MRRVRKEIFIAISSSLLAFACVKSEGGGTPSAEGSAGIEIPDGSFNPATPTGDVNCIDKTTDPTATRKLREEICALANVERKKVGASPLVLEAKRSRIAQGHATDMYLRDFFGHDSLDGTSPGERLTAAGISWKTWGENIAMNGSDEASSVVTQWMNSSGHRANILSTKYGRLGVGNDHDLWVQVFTD